MSLAGAVRWMLSSRIFASMVSVGAPGMANSTTSLRFSASAYATVLGATLMRVSGILAPSFLGVQGYSRCQGRGRSDGRDTFTCTAQAAPPSRQLDSRTFEEGLELPRARRMPQLAQRLRLDLP